VESILFTRQVVLPNVTLEARRCGDKIAQTYLMEALSNVRGVP
jgi:hypothetical protein